MSSRPKRSTVASTSRPGAPGRGHRTAARAPPRSRGCRPSRGESEPHALGRECRAIAAPMPRPAPVIRATRACKRLPSATTPILGPPDIGCLDTARARGPVLSQPFRREEHKPPMVASCEAIGQRSETVRRANLSAIVRELHDSGPLSRSELGRADRPDAQRHPRAHRRAGRSRPGLRGARRAARHARPAVAGRLTQPRRRGRPRPRDRGRLARRRGGRPRRKMFDLGASNARAATSRSTQIVADLADAAAAISRRTGRPSDLVGVGVAVVGVVRRSDGLVSMAPNLGWRDVPLGPALRPPSASRRARSPSPTRPTSGRSPRLAAVRPRAATTSCSSRARSASAAGSSSTAGR